MIAEQRGLPGSERPVRLLNLINGPVAIPSPPGRRHSRKVVTEHIVGMGMVGPRRWADRPTAL